jgi:hypothetical protein
MLTAFFEVDHVVALWRGGSNDITNLQALHRECHAAKGAAERRAQSTAVTPEQFDRLFERFDGGALPLAVAQQLTASSFGATLNSASLGLTSAPMALFPPHWSKDFERAGLAPQRSGQVLQGVRARETSTRATH